MIKNYQLKKIFFWVGNIILLILISLLILFLIFEKKYQDRIYPNIFIAGIDVSGLSSSEAQSLILEKIDIFQNRGIPISLNNRELSWNNFVYSLETETVIPTVDFDVELAVAQAYSIARQGQLSDNSAKLRLFFRPINIELPFFLNEEELILILRKNFSDLENIAQEASLNIIEKENNIIFSISQEKEGQEIDIDRFFNDFKKRLKSLSREKIVLVLKEKKPLITQAQSQGLDLVAQDLLDLAPFDLVDNFSKKSFTIEKKELAQWLSLEPEYQDQKMIGVKIGLSREKVFEYFDRELKEKIEQEPLSPNFEFKGERVEVFSPGKDGIKMNYEDSFLNISKSFEDRAWGDNLLIVEVDPVEKLENFNDLGIKELLGSGHSNFYGSSANRRHNIRVGSNKLSGMIIKPGEEFSLVKALGDVNKETGYLFEMVIKGNKTVPEYGGGLCQVATTLFRTALQSGLPITERRNHSYRVSYYEPAGTDATIYSPHPDLRFINDTGNNILIQARFEDPNDMYFDFWGSSDGRLVTSTTPVMYNIVRPGPTQIIETTDLAPGQKRCTESAHTGADTYFDYIVTYNPGTEEESVIEKRFYSKYVPWREVCLVGVEKKVELEEKIEEE